MYAQVPKHYLYRRAMSSSVTKLNIQLTTGNYKSGVTPYVGQLRTEQPVTWLQRSYPCKATRRSYHVKLPASCYHARLAAGRERLPTLCPMWTYEVQSASSKCHSSKSKFSEGISPKMVIKTTVGCGIWSLSTRKNITILTTWGNTHHKCTSQ